MPIATINWSVSEYEEPGVFLDANIRIIRVSDGHVYVDATGGAGSVQITAGTEVYIYGYSFSSSPPSYWGPTYNRATLRASVAGVTSGTEPIYKNNSDFAVSSGNFTVSAGTTYTANVATINPFSTTGNVVSVEIYLAGGSNGAAYECYGSGNYETYDYIPYGFRAFDAQGNEVTPSETVSIPIYEQYSGGEPILLSTLSFPPDTGVSLTYIVYCDYSSYQTFTGIPSVNGLTFTFNSTTFRFDRPA
jgi:hypothetical protein